MKLQGGKKNEDKKSISNLLKTLPKFKYRSIDNQIDLFFPSIDLFVFLSKKESVLFENLFIKNISIEDFIKSVSLKHNFQEKRALAEIDLFVSEIVNHVKQNERRFIL